MTPWLGHLQAELDLLAHEDLLRRLQIAQPHGKTIDRLDRQLINLASNDYLALSHHPHLQAAAIEAIRIHGTGCGASRLVSGHLQLHADVESRFAQFKKAEGALIFPTGYMANLAVITSLAGKGDLVCIDKLDHASLLDGAKASGAVVRVFPHRQIRKLDRLLAAHHQASRVSANRVPRRFIVTDSVFSMDGDCAPLPALCDLAEKYDAILVLDEAHGTGVLGANGAGLCEHLGVAERVDVVMSTASKALGGLGGIVTASQTIIDTIINRARSFIYTTAATPAQVAAIGAALDVVRDEPWRRRRVLELAGRLRNSLSTIGQLDLRQEDPITPIVPIVVGCPRAAMDLANHLQAHGLFAPAIRPPTVAPGSARVRISLRADLDDDDIDRLEGAIKAWFAQP